LGFVGLTKQQPFQEKILKEYQVAGVPTIVFIGKDGKEERKLRVESKVGKDEFLSAMTRMLN
jgi:thiol:disulfide interchange protein